MRSNPFIALFALAAAAMLGAAALPAAAQNYPARPVRIVIAFGPGGIADTIGRLVGQKLGDRFGQTFVGDNRPGAGGALAARIVAAATPDGHTLLVTTTAIAVNATSVKDAVDPRTQLIPVAIAATAPTIFVVHRSVTAKSLLEYLRASKKGRFNYGTAGVGTSEHLTSEYLFKAVPGLEGTHVPYQGGAAPVTAVVAQQVDMATTTFPTASTFIKQGALRVMAVASRKRIPALPEVPTLAEAGFIDFENASWIAFFAPAKTPSPAVRVLNAGIDDALRQPDVKDRLMALGFDIQTRSQADFAAYVKTEVEKWAQVIKATGIQPN
ncbi:MAG TPA: tripartite tricarboxylate transporter substrate-binding protein [Burkholderiales bacterium]|nr:tripartite tricarboxylate transporter substrate-binding protein [Burkholderiales bacterium]